MGPRAAGSQHPGQSPGPHPAPQRTLRTTGLPSLISWASIMATLWSMVVEWSVLSAELPTNVPRAKTAAQRTCRRTHDITAPHARVVPLADGAEMGAGRLVALA